MLTVAGFFLLEPIANQFEGSDTVAVPYVVGIRQAQAENDIAAKGLVPRARQVSSSDVEEGVVVSQEPAAGTRIEEGEIVSFQVSSGKPKVTVSDVVGQSSASAVRELTQAGLRVDVVEVNSERDEGTVTAQSLAPGTVVVEGTSVRINVSIGPKPVTVPSVVNVPYDRAAAELQRAGFGVTRVDVSSDLAKGIVVDQDPSGGSTSSRGATVTLSVSRGPSTVAVPDVTTQDVTIARATLESAGFTVREVLEDTEDPSFEGIVISQDPIGGGRAEPGSRVTLFVGRFVEPATQPETETVPTGP